MTDPQFPDRQWQIQMPSPGRPPAPEPGGPVGQVEHRRGVAGRTGRRRWVWFAAGAVVVIGAVIGGVALLTGGSPAANTPRDVGRRLFAASRTGNTAVGRTLFCATDVSSGRADGLVAAEHVTSYRIIDVAERGDRALVQAEVHTGAGRLAAAVPLVERNGTWRVCFTDPGRLLTVPSSPVPGSASPGHTGASAVSPCDFATNANDAATVFVGLAESGEVDEAQTCVLGNAVARSVTAGIRPTTTSGRGLYAPDGSTGATFRFASVDHAHRLTVTVERGANGKFHVIRVTKT